MTWTNAGQCPPVILHPDGRTELLHSHDIMLGYSNLTDRPRTDHRTTLDPGTTVLLYSDGLIERPNRDLDDGIAELRELLTTLRGRTPQDIVDTVVKTLVTDAHDDTVALAVTIVDPG
jgi:serine phosphatase RsbU (regulator of sigma subunit)